MAVELSIVMPCLNEAETLATCICKAQSYLRQAKVEGEIVIGDNGSTDGSQKIAADLGARVISIPVRGYGAALQGAITAACGRYCIMADCDDSYDLEHLDAFLEKLRAGFDLVMGNRFAGKIASGAMPWKNRYIGNPVLSTIGKLLFKAPAKDFHCGIRGFSKSAFERMDLRTTGMEFASEMVIKAKLAGLTITEVPTTLSRDGRSRPPHLRPYRDGWRHLRFMLMYSPRWLFLYPGLFAVFIGLATGLWLLVGPRRVGGVVLDIDTLFYAFGAALVGFQLIAFSVFTKVFAITVGLLPADPRLDRMFKYVKLETGLVVGGLLVFLGLACGCIAVSSWAHSGFGPMNAETLLRIVMPSVFSLTIGTQVIFSSFFLSILGLKRS